MHINKHKRILIFILMSLLILLVYDLFNEVEKRGEVTSARIFPRLLRTLLLFFFIFYYYSSRVLVKSKFNNIFISIYSLIICYIMIDISLASIVALSKILYLLFIYLFFYNLTLRYPLQTKRYLKYFVFCSVFILSTHIIFNRLGNANGIEKIYGDNNSYVLLGFLPLIYLIDSKYKNFLFFVLVLGVLLSVKRGAMFALVIAILPVFLFKTKIRKSKFKKFKNLLLLVFAVVCIFYIYDKFENIFMDRVKDLTAENGDDFGSGRGLVYFLIFNDWYASNNFFTYIFGYGYQSVELFNKKITGKPLMAHSDLFNFMHSYGLLGLSLLGWFIIYQVKTVYRLFKLKSDFYIPYFMVFIIFFFKAIYSGNFEIQNFGYMLIAYASINALLRVEKFNI